MPRHLLQVVRAVIVIVVQVGDPSAAGDLQPRVPCRGRPPVLLQPNHADPGIAGRPTLEDLVRGIGRAVIHGNQFPAGKQLSFERTEGTVERRRAIVDGENDGNQRVQARLFHCLLRSNGAGEVGAEEIVSPGRTAVKQH